MTDSQAKPEKGLWDRRIIIRSNARSGPTVRNMKMIDGQCKPASKESGWRGKERRASKRTLRQKSEEIGVG